MPFLYTRDLVFSRCPPARPGRDGIVGGTVRGTVGMLVWVAGERYETIMNTL